MSRLDEAFADLPDRLTVDQLAQVLGIDPQTAYGWLQRGTVPAYKIGRSWVILRDEIRDFLAASSNQRPQHHDADITGVAEQTDGQTDTPG